MITTEELEVRINDLEKEIWVLQKENQRLSNLLEVIKQMGDILKDLTAPINRPYMPNPLGTPYMPNPLGTQQHKVTTALTGQIQGLTELTPIYTSNTTNTMTLRND